MAVAGGGPEVGEKVGERNRHFDDGVDISSLLHAVLEVSCRCVDCDAGAGVLGDLPD